ncbi:uncharacterized protein LOC121374129 [Gigantopelta aegis]|uniref:uncharacterized protein LOC121374129 n=1 Tax=Gigantopelta aegis TaxID=1735272 RepID=UPI001B88C99C|nr:uncharacterized protein LOC121374129 [Gigantopelta aegis]
MTLTELCSVSVARPSRTVGNPRCWPVVPIYSRTVLRLAQKCPSELQSSNSALRTHATHHRIHLYLGLVWKQKHSFTLHRDKIKGFTCNPKMQNEAGEFVDMYIPRKCSASNRIIAAKDHASIQINLANVDESTGRMTGSNTTYAICGAIRRMGESDDCINRLAKRDNILPKNF